MIKNYFKIAWRNLFRNKGFSATNLLGLTIGITCTILISLWVKDELTYDKFHANYSSIYQIYANRDFNNQVFTDQNMVLPLASTIRQQIPQIKNAVVTTHRQPHILTYGENKLKKEGYTVGEGFFDMFSWKFIYGNPSTALPDAYAIVLTRSSAKALFGNDDPMNKIIKVDNEYDAKVTAVVADVPGNSTLQFDFVNAFNYNNDFLKRAMTNWQNSSWNVFIQVNPGTNMKMLEKSITDIKYQRDEGDKRISTYFAFPMNKWRLQSEFKDGKNTGGMIQYVRLFSIIAIIILLIACVNFMNLSTARSEKRAREVGVRKTLGSGKRQLIFQFFSESIILASIAFVLSVLTVYLLLPFFNDLVDKHLSLNIAEPLF
ncbi:MAG TPA: ABC transporter permease, partial [Chitinophagaceae bacterium]|nr:ABC transporter permease [Chitinophagaceae bacterium]